MKKGIFGTILLFSSLFFTLSCVQTLEESKFEEFELTDSEGNTRVGGIYLPKGVNSKTTYPVIFMEDGLVFKECEFKHMIDSLIDYGIINPIIVACSFENKMTIPGYTISYRNAEFVDAIAKTDQELTKLFDVHYSYFKDIFIPYINKKYPVSEKISDRFYFGTSNSADFGITLGMRDGDMFSEFWCYSPVYSDVSQYGMLTAPASFRICWGAKEEVGMFDYFPTLIKDIRKRGGKVESWVFNGGHDRDWWKYWFSEDLKLRFPYKVK